MLNPFITAECVRAGVPLNLIATDAPETYSQAGEDLVIEALLAGLAAKAPPTPSVYYVEIGANHPIQTSNTYLFYKKHDGHGLLVDADPELIPTLKQVRPRDQVVHAAVSDRRDPTLTFHVAKAKELSSLDMEHVQSFSPSGEVANVTDTIKVPNLHINDLLAQHATETIHYLSLDVEGSDLAIMNALDFERFRPRLLSCEPGHLYPNNPQDMFEIMARAGYSFVARTFVNMIFMDKRWL